MKYVSELDSVTGICTVNVTGEYHRPDDSEKLKRFAIDFSARHGCKLFLFNLSNAEIFGEIIPTFNAADPQGEVADKLRSIRTAFVRRELTENDRFFETVAVNRGFQLRAFDSVEKAVKWLMQGNS